MKKIFITISVLFILLGLSSCDSRADLYNKINAIEKEVDYSFTSINSDSFTIDNVTYFYEELAEEIIKKECELYIYQRKLIGDNMYFYYQYDSSGDVKYIDDHSYNYNTFDVALFKVNVTNITCELIYKFENIYPTYNYTYINPYFSFVLDENRAVVQYNGYIQILDINKKEIVESIEVYDKELYRFDGYRSHFYFNRYGDYYVKDNNRLYYYEIDGYKFKRHDYEINKDSYYIDRYDNYVYTSDFNGKREYYDCYNLVNDEPYDVNIVLEMIKENNEVKEEEFSIVIDGVTYYIDAYEGKIYIKDSNLDIIRVIDEEYMINNSSKFNDLYYLWTNNHRGYQNVDYSFTSNKLFVGFLAEYNIGNHTPLYVYEYDIVNDVVKYVGYIDVRGFGLFYLN